MTLHGDADQAIGLIRRLVAENEHLTRQVASLEQQLEASRSAGGELTPDTARAWASAMAAARPDAWKHVLVGDGRWDSRKGIPLGIGLRALLLHLTAIPGDDRLGRISWDSHWRRMKRQDLVGNYPPRFRYSLCPVSWLRQQGRAGLADTLDGLRRGLQPSSKAYCLTAAAFLLLPDPVAQLTADPGDVLDQILHAKDEACAPGRAESAKVWAEMLSGPSSREQQAAARATLEVSSDAGAEAIRQAYRAKARKHHPDAGGDAEQFHRISEAYALLTA